MLRWLFSFEGRLGRLAAWRRPIPLGIFSTLALVAMMLFLPDPWLARIGILPLFGGLLLINWLALTSVIVRRLHDIGLSGWWILTYPAVLGGFAAGALYCLGLSSPFEFLAPALFAGCVLTILVALWVLFGVPGQGHDNRFGPVPPDQRGLLD